MALVRGSLNLAFGTRRFAPSETATSGRVVNAVSAEPPADAMHQSGFILMRSRLRLLMAILRAVTGTQSVD